MLQPAMRHDYRGQRSSIRMLQCGKMFADQLEHPSDGQIVIGSNEAENFALGGGLRQMVASKLCGDCFIVVHGITSFLSLVTVIAGHHVLQWRAPKPGRAG